MVAVASMVAPRGAAGGVDPFQRSRQLAAALEAAPPQSQRPALSVGEGAVRGIGTGLRSYRAAQLAKSTRAADLQRASAIADLIAPAGDGGTVDPRREMVANYLASGGNAGVFDDAISSRFGIGGPVEAPTVQTRYGPAGLEERVQWVGGEWVPFGGAKAPAQPKPSETEKQIQELLNRGFALSDAQDISRGVARVQTDPVTGETFIVNIATGEARPVNFTDLPTGGGQPTDVSRETITLWNQAEKATGAGPAVEALATDVLPQLPGDWKGWPETTAARQDFATAGNEMIRALSVNPRFPVAEMQRIREEINIQPSFLKSPEAVKARMISLDSSLRQRLANEERAANDRTLPRTTRQAALQSADALRNFLVVMGVPEGASFDNLGDGALPLPSAGEVVDGYLFKGGDPGDPASWEKVQ